MPVESGWVNKLAVFCGVERLGRGNTPAPSGARRHGCEDRLVLRIFMDYFSNSCFKSFVFAISEKFSTA